MAGVEVKWSLRCLSTQTLLWFYDYWKWGFFVDGAKVVVGWWGVPSCCSKLSSCFHLSHKGGAWLSHGGRNFVLCPQPLSHQLTSHPSEALVDVWWQDSSDFCLNLGSAFWPVREASWQYRGCKMGRYFFKESSNESDLISDSGHSLGHWTVHWNPAKGQEQRQIKKLLPVEFCGSQTCF